MAFLETDFGAVARMLSLVSDRPDDLVECYLERSEQTELVAPAGAGLREWREEGFAVRLVSGRGVYSATRDGLDGEELLAAARQVSRRMSQGFHPAPRLVARERAAPADAGGMASFPRRVEAELRRRRLAFPLALRVRRHGRSIVVVGREIVGDPEHEDFYSVRAELEGGSWGTLLPALDGDAAKRVAAAVGAAFRARSASPPALEATALVLGPSAAAVLLHEGVAHALEADEPAASIGERLASPLLDVLDDPGAGPPGLRRRTDDEGAPVMRRWLLRGGVVEQPLADRRCARHSDDLTPGAARRQSRHFAPAPRSLHLELPPGGASAESLLADARTGLQAEEAMRGWLDPATGTLELRFAHGRRIREGALAERVGAFRIRASLAQLLARVQGLGDDARLAGAGWCAKGGQRMPVWGTTPSLLLDGVEIRPEC